MAERAAPVPRPPSRRAVVKGLLGLTLTLAGIGCTPVRSSPPATPTLRPPTSSPSNLVLCSLKAVTKETSSVPRRLRRTSPEPGFGPQVELSGGNAGGLLDLLGIGKALPRQGITAEEAPPALLEIEPARSGGNENVMDAWMRFQPGACLKTVVTTEVIRDDVDIASRIVGFNVGQQRDVAFGVARSGTAGQLLAIAHA